METTSSSCSFSGDRCQDLQVSLPSLPRNPCRVPDKGRELPLSLTTPFSVSDDGSAAAFPAGACKSEIGQIVLEPLMHALRPAASTLNKAHRQIIIPSHLLGRLSRHTFAVNCFLHPLVTTRNGHAKWPREVGSLTSQLDCPIRGRAAEPSRLASHLPKPNGTLAA